VIRIVAPLEAFRMLVAIMSTCAAIMSLMQMLSEEMMMKILEKVDGDSYSFR